MAGNEFQNGNDLSENLFAKKSNFAVWISDRERDEDEGYKSGGRNARGTTDIQWLSHSVKLLSFAKHRGAGGMHACTPNKILASQSLSLY